MREVDRIGFESIEQEYHPSYRDSTRVLVRSQELADVVYERIKYDLIPITLSLLVFFAFSYTSFTSLSSATSLIVNLFYISFLFTADYS